MSLSAGRSLPAHFLTTSAFSLTKLVKPAIYHTIPTKAGGHEDIARPARKMTDIREPIHGFEKLRRPFIGNGVYWKFLTDMAFELFKACLGIVCVACLMVLSAYDEIGLVVDDLSPIVVVWFVHIIHHAFRVSAF